jgi:hypothetical protein
VCFLAYTSHTPGDVAWFFVSHARHACLDLG